MIIPKRKDLTPRAGLYTPAPGHYKAESDSALAKHVYNAHFGASKRSGLVDGKKSGLPGPVDYYTEKMIQFKKKMPAATIGTSKRDTLSTDNRVPGPGEYQTTTLLEKEKTSKGVSFVAAKRDNSENSPSPGPAHYSTSAF